MPPNCASKDGWTARWKQVRELLDTGGRGRAPRAVPRPGRLGPPGRGRARQPARATPRGRCAQLVGVPSGVHPKRRQTYEQIQDLLREEVLDAQFAGMRERAAERDSRRLRAHARNDERAQRHARRRCARRAHARSSSTSSCSSTATSSLISPAESRRTDRRARPARGRGAALDELADRLSSAPSSAALMEQRAGRQAGLARGDGATAVRACSSARPDLRWGGARADERRRADGLLRRDRRAGRTRRPRPARRDARRRTTPARAWTTSTRS